MNPRKSSTSSANPSARPRYLGIEVTGVPTLSARWLEQVLANRLAEGIGQRPRIRVIRHEGPKAIVEVDHRLAPAARDAWNCTIHGVAPGTLLIRTVRTWGTLLKGKVWIRSRG